MKNREFLFKLIAIFLPVVFLLLLELGLRLFNIFPQPPLFFHTTKNGEAVIEINSNVGERYFNKKTVPVPNLYPQTFSAVKNDETVRIFCLGGSTTAGFPYEVTVPFPQQLQFLLQKDYPETNFEIVNLGLSAINSFTVLDWIADILRQEPDLVIIYMGHNEFYGAYGTGATISLSHNGTLTRFVLAIQRFHIIQMLKSFVNMIIPDHSGESSHTLMEKLIDNQSIPVDSDLRQKTYQNFSANLERILSACQNAETPVIISNLVSNLKDQPPLGKLGKTDPDPSNAWYHYNQGREAFEAMDSVSAYISFSKSRNLDIIPFRAPDSINAIIMAKALQYGTEYVDMNAAFRAYSPQGIPGKKLFCDHLHPNPRGYKLMANQFRLAMVGKTAFSFVNPQAVKEITPAFVTGLDWEIGAVRIFKLMQRWPFSNGEADYTQYPPAVNKATAQIAKDFVLKHNIWGKAHEEMADRYVQSGDLNQACSEYMVVIEMYPHKIPVYHKLIDCAKSANFWSLVEFACHKALSYTEEMGMFYYHLALSERMLGKLDLALESIQKAINAPEMNPGQLAYAYYYNALFQLDLDNPTEAAKLLNKAVQKMPGFVEAQKILEQLEGQ